MVKINLVRHGETDHNKNQFLCGWSDPSLNDLGRQQAKKLALHLKGKVFDAVYTSGLKRTNETANVIMGKTDETIIAHEGLREIHFGDFEGQRMSSIEKEHPQLYKKLRDDSIHFCFPAGESLWKMHHRVNKTIEELILKHQGEEILLVVHSGVIRAIIAQLITGEIKKHWHFKIDHCSLSIVEAHRDFYLLSKLNETSYLTSK